MPLDSMMFLIIIAGFFTTSMYLVTEYQSWQAGNADSLRRHIIYGQLYAARQCALAAFIPTACATSRGTESIETDLTDHACWSC